MPKRGQGGASHNLFFLLLPPDTSFHKPLSYVDARVRVVANRLLRIITHDMTFSQLTVAFVRASSSFSLHFSFPPAPHHPPDLSPILQRNASTNDDPAGRHIDMEICGCKQNTVF